MEVEEVAAVSFVVVTLLAHLKHSATGKSGSSGSSSSSSSKGTSVSGLSGKTASVSTTGAPKSVIPANQPFSGRSQGGGTRPYIYGTPYVIYIFFWVVLNVYEGYMAAGIQIPTKPLMEPKGATCPISSGLWLGVA